MANKFNVFLAVAGMVVAALLVGSAIGVSANEQWDLESTNRFMPERNKQSFISQTWDE